MSCSKMQLFLAMEEPLTLMDRFPIGIRGKCGSMTLCYLSSEFPPGHNKELSAELVQILADFQDFVNMDVRILMKEPQSLCQAIVQLHEDHPFLKRMIKSPRVESAKIVIKIECQQTSEESTPPISTLITKEMPVFDDSEKVCEDTNVRFQDAEWFNLFYSRNVAISAQISIEVIISLSEPKLPLSSQLTMLRKMLHEEVLSDAVIVASNGAQIKCHKSVLSSCSPVFHRMFQSDMVEGNTSTLELPDMSEECVRAFLAFVYYLCDDQPNQNCQLAFDLWLVAEKYGVDPDLKTAMSKILMSKPDEWYDVDVLVKIFQLARNLASGEQLKLRAVDVLRGNSHVYQSAAFKEMFQKNAEAAMEFCQLISSQQ